jgi:hypothetical protein
MEVIILGAQGAMHRRRGVCQHRCMHLFFHCLHCVHPRLSTSNWTLLKYMIEKLNWLEQSYFQLCFMIIRSNVVFSHIYFNMSLVLKWTHLWFKNHEVYRAHLQSNLICYTSNIKNHHQKCVSRSSSIHTCIWFFNFYFHVKYFAIMYYLGFTL